MFKDPVPGSGAEGILECPISTLGIVFGKISVRLEGSEIGVAQECCIASAHKTIGLATDIEIFE